MNKMSQEEFDEIQNIINTHNENDPVYIDAQERLNRNIAELQAEQKEIEQKLLEKARQIVPLLDDNSVFELKRLFRECKQKRGEEWLDYSEEDFPQIGLGLARAFNEYYGPI